LLPCSLGSAMFERRQMFHMLHKRMSYIYPPPLARAASHCAGIGVTSRIDVIVKPARLQRTSAITPRDWTGDSTSSVRMP